uniref:B30.2/SPRY domain-containing protein n=1 Tax=Chrysemys picta bellii TaxID=8478 RepID=A0A8C3HV53_CHRPI
LSHTMPLQVKLQGALGPLRKELEEALALTSKEEEKSTEWQRKVKNRRETIAGEFNKLHTLLRAEEQLLLQRLEVEERETLQRLRENVTKLSQQSSSLQQLIAEIEEKCQQPVVELLKNVKLQEPEAVSTGLKNVYKISLDMREVLKRFGVDMTLDPDTAHPWLVLSEDQKHVRLGDTHQDLPDNPERFDPCPCVLGIEGFTGGRRYWEVEGWVTLSPEDGYWAMWLRDGEYEALTSHSTPLPVSIRPSRVGIFLDYKAGEVSFYSVTIFPQSKKRTLGEPRSSPTPALPPSTPSHFPPPDCPPQNPNPPCFLSPDCSLLRTPHPNCPHRTLPVP